MRRNPFTRPRPVRPTRPRPGRCTRAVLALARPEDRLDPAIVTPFTVRFSTNDTGDIALIGNTLETASTVGNPSRTQRELIDLQYGVSPSINNKVARCEFKEPRFYD